MAKWLNPSLAFEHDMCSVHSHCLPLSHGYELHGLDSSLLTSVRIILRERESKRERQVNGGR